MTQGTGQGNDTPQLEFTWDPAKAASNSGKHGVSLSLAATVFADALALSVFDADHSESVERWFTLGWPTAASCWRCRTPTRPLAPTAHG